MKKNLIVLLLIPFLIALLGVVTINTTHQFVENDIVGIKWSYEDVEVFQKDKEYLLVAEGINEKNYPAGKGNNLIWSISDSSFGEIVIKNSLYYFIPKQKGECVITCSNEKGNVFKSLTAVIYEPGTSVIIVQDTNKSSQNNIDPNTYYGEYDLVNNEEVNASFNLNIKVVPENKGSTLYVEEQSDNVIVDLNNKKVTITGSGEAYFKISGTEGENLTDPAVFKFNIVDEGVNVYDYNDLLNCTNKSNEGRIVVLRKSFESLDYIENNSDTSAVCFGNYNSKNKSFNFNNEVYRFTTTYNKKYIDQWNNYIKSQGGKNIVSDQIIAGLRVQKDFYGNGYTINMHNLTYPSDVIIQETESGTVSIPTLSKNDLFRGPLPFYALGDPSNMPLVKAFGQDNIGMYVDGDDITINDVNLKNCDFGNMVSNLNTTGTVLETHGNNITIINSRLSNGKNIIRSFSSMNTIIKNSLISNSRNFLISIGANEYIQIDENEEYEFIDLNGNKNKQIIKSYFQVEGKGDEVLNSYIMSAFDNKLAMKNSLLAIQNSLNRKDSVEGIYKGSMIIEDCLFYRSGIASIALESMFNGPFLQYSVPSSIDTILKMLSTNDGTSLDKLKFDHLAGMSYPVELNIKGDTKFYDYKTASSLDISGLIEENISSFAASIKPDYSGVINIDKIFPVKVYLIEQARSKGYAYMNSYVNVPIAYYGGGINTSSVNIDELDNKDQFGDTLVIDFLDNYLSLTPTDNMIDTLKNMMLKSVTVVTGYEPFKFMCLKGNGYLYDETPKVSDLIENAKGA